MTYFPEIFELLLAWAIVCDIKFVAQSNSHLFDLAFSITEHVARLTLAAVLVSYALSGLLPLLRGGCHA